MSLPAQPLPTLGQNTSTEDPKILNLLSELRTLLTGGVDETNLANGSGSVLEKLGITGGGTARRGVSLNAGTGTISSTSFGNPSDAADKVTINVPSVNTILMVMFQGFWAFPSNGALSAEAALFLGANQLKAYAQIGSAVTTPDVQSAVFPNDGFEGTTRGIHTFGGGLVSTTTQGVASQQGIGIAPANGVASGVANISGGQSYKVGAQTFAPAPATGFHLGGPLFILRPPTGTYDVSVQYKRTGASALSVYNRLLQVVPISF